MGDLLFTLRLRFADKSPATVRAFDGGEVWASHLTSKAKIDVEVRHAGRVVFPLGDLWCAMSPFHTVDGIHARELVLSLIGMRPGDTDRDYFDPYTKEQIDWAIRYGEEINLIRMDRYCDPESGEVRRNAL